VAGEYEDSLPAHVMAHLNGRRVELMRSLVPEGRVLDVGCGTGALLALLPETYERVGVDVSDSMLEVARRRGLEVRCASSERLPFEADSFDLVTTFAVLHHLIEPDVVRRSLEEMVRVTRPGGRMLVWDHNPLNPYWPLLMARLPQDRGDEKLVRARTIVDVLKLQGMQEVSLRRLTWVPDFTPPRALGVMARLERRLERLPGIRALGAHNVVTAWKSN